MPRKIEVGTVVSKVFALYREHAGVILTLSALVVGVAGIVSALLAAASPVLALVGAIISLVASAVLTGMIVELARDVQDGRLDASIGGLYETAKPFIVPLILAGLLAGLGILIGFILLIVPGLILLTMWAVYAPVIVLERKGAVESLRRSRELVKGNGWEVFGAIVAFILVFIVLGAIFGAVGGTAGVVLNVIGNIITAPLIALAASVLYFELIRVKGETPAGGAAASAVGSGARDVFGESAAPRPPVAQPGPPDPPSPPTPGAVSPETPLDPPASGGPPPATA